MVLKSEYVSYISNKFNITQLEVKSVINTYVDVLLGMISNCKSVKVLNIGYVLFDNDKGGGYIPTTAYLSHIVADKLSGISHISVYYILKEFEDLIYRGLLKGDTYSIRGVLTIKLIDYNGSKRLRLKGSSSLVLGARVYSNKFFKKSVEGV